VVPVTLGKHGADPTSDIVITLYVNMRCHSATETVCVLPVSLRSDTDDYVTKGRFPWIPGLRCGMRYGHGRAMDKHDRVMMSYLDMDFIAVFK